METTTVLNKTEKPNSFEFGSAGNRHKVYYATPQELKEHLDALSELGFVVEIPTKVQ
jgi:hypothetical protein